MPAGRPLSIAFVILLSSRSVALGGIDDGQLPCEAFSRSSAVFVGVAGAPVTRVIALPNQPRFEMTLTPMLVERVYLGVSASVVYVTPAVIEERPTPGKRYLIYGGEYSVPDIVMASPGFGAKEIEKSAEDLTFLDALPTRVMGGMLAGTVRLRQRTYDGDLRVPVPLGGILVRIAGQASKEATSDHEGRFVVTDLPTGQYELKPILPDTLIAGDPTTRFTTSVREGGCSLPVIDVTTNGRIRGVVRGPDGMPLRTSVDIVPTDNDPDSDGRIPGMHSVQSNDQGEFLATGLPGGRYYVGVNLYKFPSRGGPTYPRTYYPGTTNVVDALPVVVGDGLETSGLDLAIPMTLPKSEITVLVEEEDAPEFELTLCVIELKDRTKRRFTWRIRAGVPHPITVIEGQQYEIHVHGEHAGVHLDAKPLVFTATAEKTTVNLKPDVPRKLH